jgi:hypothetical protein
MMRFQRTRENTDSLNEEQGKVIGLIPEQLIRRARESIRHKSVASLVL